VGSGETKFERFWTGDRLGKDKADTSDLRCVDNGVYFVAGVRGRPGGECSEMLQMDGSKTGGNSVETRLG
jgi:hypothetical protein